MTRKFLDVFCSMTLLCAALSGAYAASVDNLAMWGAKDAASSLVVPLPGPPSYTKSFHDSTAVEGSLPKELQDALAPTGNGVDISATTPYAALEQLFKTAAPAKREDVMGWYAGRMFHPDAPRKQIGSLLTGYSGDAGAPPGGLFTSTAPFKIGLWYTPKGLPVTYYDDISGAGVTGILGDIKQWDERTLPANILSSGTEGGLAVDDGKVTFEVRKYDKFLIVKNGATPYYHYYFRNVTPKNEPPGKK